MEEYSRSVKYIARHKGVLAIIYSLFLFDSCVFFFSPFLDNFFSRGVFFILGGGLLFAHPMQWYVDDVMNENHKTVAFFVFVVSGDKESKKFYLLT